MQRRVQRALVPSTAPATIDRIERLPSREQAAD